MDMLEKAARAAAHAVHKFYNGQSDESTVWAVCNRETQDAYRAEARAVLLAIREPDEAMVRSFTHSNVSGFNVRNGSICATPHNAAAAWQRMIDAILTTDATKETK